MAFQPLNLGTVANDRTGDTWRAGGTKINANFTELFAKEISNRVIVNSAADFPTVVAGKIPLAADTEYFIGSNAVTVPDEFTVADNVTFNGANGAALLTYTGTGNMFEGDGVGLFTIKNVALNAPTGKIFGITDTIQGTVINLLDYRIISCTGLGTVTGVLAFVMEFGTVVDMDQGIVLAGSISVISITKLFGFSTKATFKAVDLGTSAASTLEFTNMALSAPAGAFGISGLASNGNVTAGNIANVTNCEFLGGMTPLETITVDDVRWNFQDNSANLPDTNPDALISLTSNVTETSIAAANTPVLAAGTWVVQSTSHYTGTAAGRATYNGEKDLTAPVTLQATISAASGTNKDVTIYVAENGAIISAARSTNRVGASDPRLFVIPWQVAFAETDFVELWVENNTDTVNLIVENAIMRVR